MSDVQADEQRGEALDHPGIVGKARIDGMQSHVFDELHHCLPGIFVIAAHEYVTVNGVLEMTQLMRRHVLEGGHYFDAVA